MPSYNLIILQDKIYVYSYNTVKYLASQGSRIWYRITVYYSNNFHITIFCVYLYVYIHYVIRAEDFNMKLIIQLGWYGYNNRSTVD